MKEKNKKTKNNGNGKSFFSFFLPKKHYDIVNHIKTNEDSRF